MRFPIFLILMISILMTSSLVFAADGDTILISSQNPANGYTVAESDEDVSLSFSFTGDNATCVLYGNWSDAWTKENDSYINISPALYNFDVATSNFVCNNAYKWNVICSEDNNSANFDWGENRTIFYECVVEKEPQARIVKKTFSVLFTQPWYGEAMVGNRWIFENETANGTRYYNLYVTNITAYSISLWAIPSNKNYTLDFAKKTVDIDLNGDKNNDITFTLERLYAWEKAIISFNEVGYTGPASNDTANETINTTNDINITANDTIDINATKDIINKTINMTGNMTANDTITNGTTNAGSSVSHHEPPNQKTSANDTKKEGFPLWILALIFLIMVLVVVYLAYKLMAPLPS